MRSTHLTGFRAAWIARSSPAMTNKKMSGYTARSGIGARIRNAKPAIGARRVRHSRARLRDQREPPRGAVAAGGDRAWLDHCARFADAQSAAGQDRLCVDQRRGACAGRGDARRHRFRVRLCRRRAAAVRGEKPGQRLRAGLRGAAGGADHQRLVLAVVLLAHHAADRARVLLGAGKDARRRRRRRAVHRGRHFCRQCRGAAVHPAVSGARCRAAKCSSS